MDKETKKKFRNHKVDAPRYKDVPLTDDEFEDAVLQKAQLESRIESNELNLKHLEADEKNKYSERLSVLNARNSLKDMRDKLNQDLDTTKKNLQVFTRQVKTKMREEPIEDEVKSE